jgi:hypothetical protein
LPWRESKQSFDADETSYSRFQENKLVAAVDGGKREAEGNGVRLGGGRGGELGVEVGGGGGGRGGAEGREVGPQLGRGGAALAGHVEEVARERGRLGVEIGEAHRVLKQGDRQLLLLALALIVIIITIMISKMAMKVR